MAEKIDSSVQTDPVIIKSCRKRPLEDDDIVLNKKYHSNVILKMLIPNVSVGAILGKKGEDIINAQQNSGAVAKISKVGEFYPGTNERICLISGASESIINFTGFVVDKIINTYDQINNSSQMNKRPQIKLLVSNAAAGVIIGKNGKYVQEIKEESGVHIQLSQKVEGSLVSERCVVISGNLTQLLIAIKKIVNAISQDCAFNSLSMLNYVATNSQSLYQQSVWGNSVAPENYAPVSISKSLLHNIDPNNTFMSECDQTYRNISNKMDKIERSIEIPETIVGHILGKRGSSISELKSHTSTDIKVSKKGIYAPNTTNRIVTVIGLCQNVEYAIRLITQSIQNEERRRSLADPMK